jgi:hypothetical protein
MIGGAIGDVSPELQIYDFFTYLSQILNMVSGPLQQLRAIYPVNPYNQGTLLSVLILGDTALLFY